MGTHGERSQTTTDYTDVRRMKKTNKFNHEWTLMFWEESSDREEYAVLGSRRMDCIGRWESDRADREMRVNDIEGKGARVAPSESGDE